MKKYFNHIYNEIISKEEWEKKYKRDVYETFDEKQYNKILPYLKDLFTKLNGGTFAETVIMDYKTKQISRLNKYDKKLIPILIELDYTISKNSYLIGKALKNDKEINILDILSGLNSKIKTKEQLKTIAEKNKGAKKQLDAIEKLNEINLIKNNAIDISKLSIYNLNKEKDYKIVFSMDQRAIASQSTDVGWKSCMNLNSGEYKQYVGSGISAGVFIAYLTQSGDEFELNNPKARVLIKPLFIDLNKLSDLNIKQKENPKEVIWDVEERVYPREAPQDFQKQIKKIINDIYKQEINDKEYSFYFFKYNSVYNDGMEDFKLHGDVNKLTEDQQLELILKGIVSLKEIKKPSDKILIYLINKSKSNINIIKEINNNILENIENLNEINDYYIRELVRKCKNITYNNLKKMVYYSPSVITIIKPKDQTEELQDIVVQQTKGEIFDLIKPKNIKSDEIFKKAIIMKPFNIRKLEIDGHYGVSVLNRILDKNFLKQLFDNSPITILYYKSIQDKITKELFSYICKKYNYEILYWLDEIDQIDKKNGIYIDDNFLIDMFNNVPSDKIFHYFTKIIDYLLSKNETDYTYSLIDKLLNIGIKKNGNILYYLTINAISVKFKNINSIIQKYIEPALLNATNISIIKIFEKINNSENFKILIKAIKRNEIFKKLTKEDISFFNETQQKQIFDILFKIYPQKMIEKYPEIIIRHQLENNTLTEQTVLKFLKTFKNNEEEIIENVLKDNNIHDFIINILKQNGDNIAYIPKKLITPQIEDIALMNSKSGHAILYINNYLSLEKLKKAVDYNINSFLYIYQNFKYTNIYNEILLYVYQKYNTYLKKELPDEYNRAVELIEKKGP